MNGYTPFAGDEDLGSHQPVHLFAGSADIVTDTFPVGSYLAQYQVFAVSPDGSAVPHDPAASDGTEKAVGITLFEAHGGNVTGYIGGDFNHEALVWDFSLDTLAKRKAAFLRTNIAIKSLL